MLLGERFALTSWIARLASVSLHLQRSCSACDATLRCPSAVSGWACADSPTRANVQERLFWGSTCLCWGKWMRSSSCRCDEEKSCYVPRYLISGLCSGVMPLQAPPFHMLQHELSMTSPWPFAFLSLYQLPPPIQCVPHSILAFF